MADAVIHIGENSPEKVAYQLLQDIMAIEGKTTSKGSPSFPLNPGITTADRKWYLDTYAECLRATRAIRLKNSPGDVSGA
jgi:hypothetical protein